jgi:hypothetical protein
VPSWFFGDGAVLFNQVLTQFAANTGASFPRIAPIDAVLRANGGRLGRGGGFGLRIGRDVTPTLTAEISIESGSAKMDLRASLLDGLAAGGDSFRNAFTAFFNTAPVTNLNVTSTVTTKDDQNTQVRVAGALKWTVFNGNRIKGYVTGGGGFVNNTGESAQAILTGRYSLLLFGTYPMEQSDVVAVTVNQPKYNAMGLVGGGVTFALSPSVGLRADARLLLTAMKDVTTLATFPANPTFSPPIVLPTAPGISPGIQFSTQPEVPSSLSIHIEKVTLFTGSGLRKEVSFSLGIFKRF